MTFNPNSVGVSNGNIFGFPIEEINAEHVIIPIPWDVTASYKKGSSLAPKAILKASTQLDFCHLKLNNADQIKVYFAKISSEWQKINDKLSQEYLSYNQFLENGGDLSESLKFQEFVNVVNNSQIALRDNLYERSKLLLNKDIIVSVVGGEHSVPLGLLMALNEKYSAFGILQIDAHCDLRQSYQGIHQSHASIFHNILQECTNVTKVVQLGVRDFSSQEFEYSINSEKIISYFDSVLKEEKFSGKTWDEQTEVILNDLPQNVYISFDVDGLNPSLCPNTGTPVPGGINYDEIIYLIFKIAESGRKIIGFDLCEVSPNPYNDWDANVGARLLWELVCAVEISKANN